MSDPSARSLLASYVEDARTHRIGRRFLPSRDEIVGITLTTLELLYPGYWGRTSLPHDELERHVSKTLGSLRLRLREQVELSLRHREETGGEPSDGIPWEQVAARIADAAIDALPSIRRVLLGDVQAAFDGDPAAKSLDEVILAYPGVLAVSVHRVAHKLHALGVPLLPRVMAEWAHARTGADIHPGATIGERFFIDHATGVVIGETTVLGSDVKLYQGVTLGALSRPHDAFPRSPRRHPTVEDRVTIYANATILGGRTVIGADSVIGAGAFITRSVPGGTSVRADSRPRRAPARRRTPVRAGA